MANKNNVKKKKSGVKNNTSNIKVEKNTKDIIDEKNKEAKQKTVDRAKRELVYADSGNNEISKLIKIVLIVTGIMIVFYGVTVIVTKNANAVKNNKDSKEETSIQYNNLIIGSMLNKDGDYYVLIEKDDDEHLTEYKTAIQMVGISDENNRVYEANLNDSFNKKYLAEESNYDSDLTKFKVKGTTLIKVSDHMISETFDNYDDIKSKLEELQ